MYYTTTQRHESESTLAIQNFESLSWKKGHEPQLAARDPEEPPRKTSKGTL